MADKKISALTSASIPLAGTEVLPIVQSGSTVKVPVSDLTAGRAVSASSVSTTGNSTFNTTANVGWTIGARSDNLISAIYSTSVTPSSTNYVLQASASITYLNHPIATSLAVNDNAIATATAAALTIPGVNLAFGTAGKGINFTANTPAAGMTSQLLNWYEEGTWTPTVTSSSGSITTVTASGVYTRVGRLVTATFTYNITNAGTGSGVVRVTSPFAARAAALYPTGSVAEVAVAGWGGYCIIEQNTSTITVQKYDGGYAGSVNVIVRGTITYEA